MRDLVLARPYKTSAMLLEFKYGNGPTMVRYTDWDSPVTYLGFRYEPVPAIEVVLPEATGGIKESPLEVTMPLDAFTARLSSGEPHAPVELTLRELVLSDTDGLADVSFRGDVGKTIRNDRGDSQTVRLSCDNVKQLLGSVSLGLPADPECAWVFGDFSCAINALALAQVGLRVVQIVGTSLTLTGLDESKRWLGGFVELDGLRIGIRTRVGQTLGLRVQPPQSWAEQLVNVVPGCRKTITDCRSYGNEAQFMGLGFAIPEYQPVIEAP